MEDRILKGYWQCPYCDTKDIDGLVDTCPGCGVHKPETVRYYMRSDVDTTGKVYSKQQVSQEEAVKDEELEKAGVAKEECDGQHKEWICSYCNSLNNWADEFCSTCRSPKEESQGEYKTPERQPESEPPKVVQPPVKVKKQKGSLKNRILAWSIGIAAVLAVVALFWPYTKTISVTGFSWERNIYLEEYRTLNESDWTIPSGGREYDRRTEVRSYENVLDHYETVTETKTRQVLDHYETTYTYTDNGNGTFTEHAHENPVYRTETYTDTHEKPVYRQEPVYDTKYYYEIDKWVKTGEEYPSQGEDKNPYWNENYTLSDKERDTSRAEAYYVEYDNGESVKKWYNEWLETELGDKVQRKTCLLGIVYQEEDL